jgi:hypothetical protein
MDKQPEPDGDSLAAQKEVGDGRKRPYRTPRLVTYGNLRELALAKGGTKNDGGPAQPASKT